MIQCSRCGRDLKGSKRPLEDCPCKKEKEKKDKGKEVKE